MMGLVELKHEGEESMI